MSNSQNKTLMKVADEAGEAAIDRVAAVEAATAVEAAETSMAETPSFVVVAAVVTTRWW